MSDLENKVNNDNDEIPSILDEENKKKKSKYFLGLIVLLAAGVLILFSMGSSDTTNEENAKVMKLEAQIEKDYEIANRKLKLPKIKNNQYIGKRSYYDGNNGLELANNDPIDKSKTGFLVRPKISDSVIEEQSAEEIRAIEISNKLWEKRRRATPVVFDGNTSQESNISSRNNNHSINIDDITNNVGKLINQHGAPSGLNGSADKNEMASRLNTAKTIGITASFLADKPHTIAEGKIIGCILETAISSALPGMTRCILAENIYSYNGEKLLLKKGSRLVGQYKGGLQAGENRIFVIWTRIITPGGIDIALNSPGSGELGQAGHGVFVDSHFFERFGASALLSIVGGFAASESENDIRLSEVAKSFNQSAAIALKDSIKIKPTGHKNQGERIKVFVARDIDFGPVMRMAEQELL